MTKPPAYDLQGVSIDDLIDFTPELRAEAVKLVSRYKIGPLFTPPSVSKWEGPLASADGALVNGRHQLAGRLARSRNQHPLRLFVPQRRASIGLMPTIPARSDMTFINAQARDPSAPPPAGRRGCGRAAAKVAARGADRAGASRC